MFRTLRVLILLTILVIVGGGTWLTKLRTTSWERPLRVAIFPVVADGSEVTQRYVRALSPQTFHAIADFMQQEGARYRLPLNAPIEIFLAPEVKQVPPPPPFGGSALQVGLWSLQIRYW